MICSIWSGATVVAWVIGLTWAKVLVVVLGAMGLLMVVGQEAIAAEEVEVAGLLVVLVATLAAMPLVVMV
jgi:hypothetical protein